MNNFSISSKVLNLSELAEYQNGSIVSRMIFDKEAGSVTFFAFDKGQGLSEHSAPYDAMVYVLEGEVEIMIAGKSHLMKTGNILIMPQNKPHSVKAVDRLKMLLIMIRD